MTITDVSGLYNYCKKVKIIREGLRREVGTTGCAADGMIVKSSVGKADGV